MNETETFQHYQVLRREDGSLWELGRGAMGVTYKAFDVNLRCPVALKVINTAYLDHPVARQRFIREARAAAQLRHRNIASVYHLGMDAQSFFYAMEFIDGETLDSLVRRTGPLPAGVALRIALQTTRALNAAARRRLLHRDIKPTNLMIVDEDEEAEGEGHLVVKVIDFGLARSIVHGDVSTQLTVSGFVGTPQYASPEQLEEKDLDARSDIYSLGVTLWFLLAGRPPFMGTLTSLVAQHLTKQPPWPQLENAPEPVRALLGRMLQKDPALRPQSPSELRREIETCLKAITTGNDPDAASADLEADDLRLSETVASNRALRGDDLGVGTLVANRFQLTRLMGEGTAGKVFQAQDILAGDGRLVAVKVFNRESIITPQDYEALTTDVARVRAARHPNLLEVFSLERHAEHACLVMEWGGGVTLIDVLRSRGIVTVGEALRLLKQAAAAADHAMAHDLRRLELRMHQVLIVSSEDQTHEIGGRATGILLADKSPALLLKIDAVSTVRDAGDLATWAGKITLVPQQPALNRDTRSSIDGLIEGTYTHALGLLFYELVSGAPPAGDVEAAGETRYAPLPMLDDAGNAVLRRALSVNPGFAGNGEFFEKLARAAGFDPANLGSEPVRREETGGFHLSALARKLPLAKSPHKTGQAEHPAPHATEHLSGFDTKAQTVSPTGASVGLEPAQMVGGANSGTQQRSALPLGRVLILAGLILLALFGIALATRPNHAVVAVASPKSNAAAPPVRVAPSATATLAVDSAGATISETTTRVEAKAEVEAEPARQPAPLSPLLASADRAGVLGGQTPQSFADRSFGHDHWESSSAGLATNEGSFRQVAVFPAKNANPLSLFIVDDTFVGSEKIAAVTPANRDAKSAAQKRQTAKARARKPSRRPTPEPNFWQRLFGAKPAARKSK